MIDDQGEQLGIMVPFEALKIARERGLDLVEVSPNAVPPVCRIQDYGKFLYEKDKSERAARKKQKVIVVKEVKFSVTVDEHDYQTKKNQAVRFLNEGDKVKASLRFKGRQMAHRELGYAIINRLIQDMGETGIVEFMPRMEGTTLHAILAPGKKSEAQRAPKPPAALPQRRSRPRPSRRRSTRRLRRSPKPQSRGRSAGIDSGEDALREPTLRTATAADLDAIRELIAASVRGLQHEYSEGQREQALASVFTPDTQLIADGSYFILEAADGTLAACGGWSWRKTLYGGDHHHASRDAARLDPATDAAKIRAFFVHPQWARRGLGTRLLAGMRAGSVGCGLSPLRNGRDTEWCSAVRAAWISARSGYSGGPAGANACRWCGWRSC